ncbi:hypothetical protein KHC23_05740 [Ancylobacter dichloromethanicus]|uniref:Uncharacterized protein n=2 Tax=Ancylobacter dichloromethanicus TaxID=518825 RepID=A0A9W6N0C2_9HYPH|nr:hypothetical protein [Ancylobacter dichloromethanicus]GLK72925.1 hypothetical protein GCM10017643_30410 [Ancylobacter dichloromethanicus]
MVKDVERRARSLCAADAERANVPATDIPPLVERLWPVAAREMMGVADPYTLVLPEDIEAREQEYRRLRR